MRPERLVLIAGTGTEVGKTWVGAHLLQEARGRGATVAARKPAQSFEPGDPDTDAGVLGRAAGVPPTEVCPPWRCYPVAMAPPMAADALGLPAFTMAQLVGEMSWPVGVALGVIEAAGGVRSPLAGDGDTVDLADAVMPDVVVLVSEIGLGAINAVRLCLDALHGHPVIVYLNRFVEAEDLHHRNRAWLLDHTGRPTVSSIDDLAAMVLSPNGSDVRPAT